MVYLFTVDNTFKKYDYPITVGVSVNIFYLLKKILDSSLYSIVVL